MKLSTITPNLNQNSHVMGEPIEVSIPCQFINKDELLQVIAQAIADHLETSVTVQQPGHKSYSLSAAYSLVTRVRP